MCSSDFQADVKALVDSTGEQRSDLDLEDLDDVYDDGPRQVLDRHVPSVTRRVRDRPSAPLMSEEIGRHDDRGDEPNDDGERPASQCIERSWLKRAAVRSCVQVAKRQSIVTELTPNVQAGSSSWYQANCLANLVLHL